MKKIRRSQEGFTAVELLITLFVAAAFLVTGFQLYTFILRSGSASYQMALANNAAYVNLRQLASSSPDCASLPSSTSAALTGVTGLTSPTITQTVTAPYGCPWGGSNSIMKVEINVTYGPSNNRQGVYHALYVQR